MLLQHRASGLNASSGSGPSSVAPAWLHCALGLSSFPLCGGNASLDKATVLSMQLPKADTEWVTPQRRGLVTATSGTHGYLLPLPTWLAGK